MIADFAVVKRCPRFASMAYARSLQRCTTRAATFEAGFAIRHPARLVWAWDLSSGSARQRVYAITKQTPEAAAI